MSGARIVTAGQNPFQLPQSGAEQSTFGGPLSGGAPSSGASDTGAPSVWAWILAFTVLGFLLWLVNKSRIGHVILYYLLVLATISTLLINYRWLAGALQPLAALGRPLSQPDARVPPEGGGNGR